MSNYLADENNVDTIGTPWWVFNSDDYTRKRTGALGYTINDLIGRRDSNKFKLTTDDPAATGAGSGNLITS